MKSTNYGILDGRDTLIGKKDDDLLQQQKSETLNNLKSQGANVQQGYHRTISCGGELNPRHNFGVLSLIVDYFIIVPNLLWSNSLFAWMPKKEDLYFTQHDPILSKSDLKEGLSQYIKPPWMFNWFMMKSALMFKWLVWNDGNLTDLRVNMKESQQNIALVSALSLTVVTAFLREADEGGSSVVAGDLKFACVFYFASFTAATATMLAVAFILMLGELSDQSEAKIFSDRMGNYMHVPIVSLMLSGFAAIIGISYWIIQCFNWKVEIGLIAVMGLLFLPLAALPFMAGVQSVWICSETSNEINKQNGEIKCLIYDYSELHQKLCEYRRLKDGFEKCTPRGYIEFLQIVREEKSNFLYHRPLGHVTELLAEECFRAATLKYIEEAKQAYEKSSCESRPSQPVLF